MGGESRILSQIRTYCMLLEMQSIPIQVKSVFLFSLILLLVVGGVPACAQAERNYLEILRVFWSEIYPDGGKTLYCNRKFAPFDRRVNVEHVYPMSWVGRSLKCGKRDQCRRTSSRFNLIESDMHNLYPARKDVNQTRGSYPFSQIKGEQYAFKGCDFEVDYSSRQVEPAPEARGRIARAMLYMAEQYDLDIFKRQRSLLEKWHRQFPPDAEEKRRNELIEAIQGNRNPYIQ